MGAGTESFLDSVRLNDPGDSHYVYAPAGEFTLANTRSFCQGHVRTVINGAVGLRATV